LQPSKILADDTTSIDRIDREINCSLQTALGSFLHRNYRRICSGIRHFDTIEPRGFIVRRDSPLKNSNSNGCTSTLIAHLSDDG
jgi:hypothetical protein